MEEHQDDWGVYCECCGSDTCAPTWSKWDDCSPTVDYWPEHERRGPLKLEDCVLRLELTGGCPYSNVHFYRNLQGQGGVQRFALVLDFEMPATSCNNSGTPSIVQALEFTASYYDGAHRHECAVQWQNVRETSGPLPTWRYWNSTGWADLGIPQCLEAGWHHLRLDCEVTPTHQTHYLRLVIDQQSHDLSSHHVVPQNDSRTDMAVAIQLDGNSTASPYTVGLDHVCLFTDIIFADGFD